MKDRLLKFLNKEQLSSARFAEIIGVQPSSISHILSGRNKPGFDFIQKILGSYPLLNADWLIMGKGNMFKSEGFQRDLFSDVESGPTGNHNVVPDGERVPETDSDYIGNEDNEFIDTYVTKGNEGNNYKSNFKSGNVITSVNKGKFVEKIVIFYTDKTFNEYLPE